ncbi:MAG: GNAT family N-acetyltransferase [Hyphomicrobiales bacterium]
MASTEQAVTEVVPHCTAADWDRIYALDEQALPSQSSAWTNAICVTGGYALKRRKYIFQDGTEAALCLFSKNHSITPFQIQRSPPAAWGFGGPISTRPLSSEHLRAILDDCARLPGAAMQIRPNPLVANIWSDAAAGSGWTALPRKAHVLDLQGGFEAVWNHGFLGRTRSHARKAERLGITVHSGSGAELVEEFDALFRLSILRWARKQNEFPWLASLRGQIRDPKKKFLEMARLCSDVVRIMIARKDGRAIAGIVVLYGNNAHYTRGAMDDQAVGNSGTNSLLQATAIKEACERNCRYYHMGESGESASLTAFKAQFGAVGHAYAEYFYEHLPVLSARQELRTLGKKLIGFRDV